MHTLLRFLPKGASPPQILRSRPWCLGTIRRNFFTSISSRRAGPLSPRLKLPTAFHRPQFRKLNSSRPSPGPVSEPSSATPTLSVTQRFRKLSREYGYSAVGVYLFLSALDFPFCFLAVRTLGTDRIAYWEHVVIAWFWKIVPWPFPAGKQIAGDGIPEGSQPRGAGWGVEDAEKANSSPEASM